MSLRAQVRRASGITADPNGSMNLSTQQLGQVLLHYSYDALGRGVRVQRPTSTASTPAQSATLNITDLYSDGVRVVQEVGWGGATAVPVRPQLTNGSADTSKPGLPRRANEVTLTTGEQSTGVTCATATSAWNWSDRRLERERVWVADPGAYVDECVAQLVYTDAHTPVSGAGSGTPQSKGDDTTATILYVLTDQNADVIGLMNSQGNP